MKKKGQSAAEGGQFLIITASDLHDVHSRLNPFDGKVENNNSNFQANAKENAELTIYFLSARQNNLQK